MVLLIKNHLYINNDYRLFKKLKSKILSLWCNFYVKPYKDYGPCLKGVNKSAKKCIIALHYCMLLDTF